jgi:hypothetical protein
MPDELIAMHVASLAIARDTALDRPTVRYSADPPLRALRDAYLQYQVNRGHAPRTIQELFPNAVDGRDNLSGDSFSVDEHDAVDQVF